jgi:hypothetical protein
MKPREKDDTDEEIAYPKKAHCAGGRRPAHGRARCLFVESEFKFRFEYGLHR